MPRMKLVLLFLLANSTVAAAEDRPFFGVRFGEGAKIEHLFDGAPAQAAGLQVGDVIKTVDEKPIADTAAMQAVLAQCKPGDKLAVVVQREGEDVAAEVQLVKHTVRFYLKDKDPPRIPGGTITLGRGTIGSDYQTSGNTCITGPSKITGSLTQTWTGVMDLRLTKPGGPPALTVSGPVSLAGLLYVKIEGYKPKMGDRFKLIGGAPALTGEFDELMLPELDKNLAWKVVYDDIEQMRDLDGDKLHDVTLVVIDGRMPLVEK